jgi:hypothetical protein
MWVCFAIAPSFKMQYASCFPNVFLFGMFLALSTTTTKIETGGESTAGYAYNGSKPLRISMKSDGRYLQQSRSGRLVISYSGSPP